MSASLLMGIDIGTSESKGCLVDFAGNVIAYATEKHGMENPKPNYYEQDAEAIWWHDMYTLSNRLLEQSGKTGEDVACVGLSTLGTCLLPVDENLKPLRKAILYGIDARSVNEIAWLTEYYGEERVKELFGRPMVSGDVCAKILWVRNNEPEVYAKTYKFLTGTSYLVAKLTGKFMIDRFLGLASFRPFFDAEGRKREEMFEPFCRPDQLPDASVVTDIAGHVTAEAAQITGLKEGTPVIIGTGDSTAEAISTGVLHAGDVMLQFGSSTFIYCCTDRLVTDDRVRGNNFTIPGTFSLAAGTNNCGLVTQWFRDKLFPELLEAEEKGGPNAYEAMMDAAKDIPIGSDGLVTLPYLAGERTPINDPDASGVVLGLRSHHTKEHLYHSALEGIAFSVAQHIDIFREHEISPLRIHAVGGATRNALLMQMVADAIREPVHIAAVTIGACYGDALMAGIGAGVFPDFESLQGIVRASKVIEPDPDNFEAYEKFRAIYDEAYLATKDFMHRLARP